MHISRNWLQKYFSEPLPPAEQLAELFTFHSFEVEGVEQVGDDFVLDIDVLANRSSDCLSHRGIARELSVLLGIPLARDPLREPLPTWESAPHLRATVTNHDLCARHMAATMRGVTVKESPAWLQTALAAIGQKSINNIVDATNYVMYDLGQPVHAFDLDKLEAKDGARALEVTNAEQDEIITLLGGATRTLSPKNLVIRDMVSGYALDIAGVKGGTQAELTNETTDIVIDCANFNYVSVRKTSRELRVQTDASVRFQNEPSPILPAFAMRDVIKLITDIAGGQLVGVSDAYREPPTHEPVSASLTDINSLLGTALSAEDVERIMVRFEFDFSRDENDVFTVTPPWERTDIRIPADLIEEIGRVHGYGSIAGVLPPPANPPQIAKAQYYSDLIRSTLLAREYSEVYTYTLRANGEVALENPLASDKAFMRLNLREGMTDALVHNTHQASLLGLDTVKIFELGTVFRTNGEDLSLCIGVRAVRGKQKDAEEGLAEDVHAVAAALGLTELPGAYHEGIFETDLGAIIVSLEEPQGAAPALPWKPSVRYKPWSNYPCVLRDIAVWVPEAVSAEEVLARIVTETTDLLVRHDLFDDFTKNGRRSYAYHLVFQAPDRTLSDAEVNGEIARVAEAFRRELWEIR